MQELLSLANHMADEAGQVIRRYFRQPFDIESKSDESPVTVADRAVEAALRKIIEAQCPDDGILGEEYGPKAAKNGRTWVIDPIDGTKSFIVGRPTFGTLIALCEDDMPVLGVIDQPIAGERWVGDGKQTTFNGKAVKTRPCPTLKQAVATTTSPKQIPTLWPRLYDECKTVVWGGDCYSYGLMACGWIDVVIEDLLAPYDFAALPPIIQGAGGWMGDWNGNPLTLSSKGNTIAVGDAALKEAVIALLKS
jgi:inositol-phosphate phosphatase/L-galactose 1-phosphate phosphatase/histidinol-phosphatase